MRSSTGRLLISLYLLIFLPSPPAASAARPSLVLEKTDGTRGPRFKLIDPRKTPSIVLYQSWQPVDVRFHHHVELEEGIDGVLIEEFLGPRQQDERWRLLAWKPATGEIIARWRAEPGENTYFYATLSKDGPRVIMLVAERYLPREHGVAERWEIGYLRERFGVLVHRAP